MVCFSVTSAAFTYLLLGEAELLDQRERLFNQVVWPLGCDHGVFEGHASVYGCDGDAGDVKEVVVNRFGCMVRFSGHDRGGVPVEVRCAADDPRVGGCAPTVVELPTPGHTVVSLRVVLADQVRTPPMATMEHDRAIAGGEETTLSRGIMGRFDHGALQDVGPCHALAEVGDVLVMGQGEYDRNLTGRRDRCARAWALIHGDGWPERLTGVQRVPCDVIGVHSLEERVTEPFHPPRASHTRNLPREDRAQGLAHMLASLRTVWSFTV
jgi:hypothetical protein